MGTFREQQGAAGRYRAADKPRPTSQTLGFLEGFSKPYGNLGNWAADALEGMGVDLSGVRTVAKRLQAAEAEARRNGGLADARPGRVGRVAGEVAGTTPILLATKNPALVGGAQGALLTDHPDDLGAVAVDTVGGAILNKVGGAALDKVADIAAPVLRPAVQKLKAAGVRLTPGQIKGGKALVREDKAMSRPFVGEKIAADRTQGIEDFNRGAVNRALLPLGVRLPDHVKTGHDAVAFMQDQAGKAFDNIMPKLALKADARIAAGLRSGWQVAQDLPPELQQRFLATVQGKLRFDGSGQMQGRPLASGIRSLKKLAAELARSGDPDQRILGEALGHVDDGVQSALRAQNAGYGKALDAANTAYKGNIIVSGAAKGADEGVFSTVQLKTAVRQADRTKNQRATAAGRAHMQDYSEAGREVLPARTPDSGTAGRLNDGNLLAKALGFLEAQGYEASKRATRLRAAKRPPVLEKFGRFLQDHRPEGAFLTGGLLGGLLGDE